MKNYPRTVEAIGLTLAFAAILALTALWHPFAYVLAGGVVLLLIVDSVRRDRKAKKLEDKYHV